MATATEADAPELAGLKFLVTAVVGTGPGGVVTVVTDRRLRGGTYALRVIKRESAQDDATIERARAESAAAQKLDHPAILKVHDFRLVRSWFRVARAEQLMEYVEGKGLDTLGRLELDPALLVAHRAAAALAYLHRRGVVHGDVRPSRFLIGRGWQVKARGFGQALVREPFRGQVRADAGFAAPERAKDGVRDTRADIYGLGATIYHALTGRPPVDAQLGRVEGRKIPTPAALNPAVPGRLNDLVVACLQASPARRPASMFEVARVLEEMADGITPPEEVATGRAGPR